MKFQCQLCGYLDATAPKACPRCSLKAGADPGQFPEIVEAWKTRSCAPEARVNNQGHEMNENTPTDLQPGDYRVEGHGAVVRVVSRGALGSTLDGYVPAQEAPQQVRHLEADRQHVQDQAQLRQEGKQPWEQAK